MSLGFRDRVLGFVCGTEEDLMKRSKFSGQQIAFILHHASSGGHCTLEASANQMLEPFLAKSGNS